MKRSIMKMPVGKGLLLVGVALFVLGTAAGSLVVYRYQAHVHAATASAPPQTSVPMASMPGMSAKQTSAQDPPKGDMANMPGMSAQLPKTPESAPAGDMANMPGMDPSKNAAAGARLRPHPPRRTWLQEPSC